MDWIKVEEGYIKKDSIITVHTSKWTPGIVYVGLTNGEVFHYKDYDGDEAAAKLAIEELMDFLAGRGGTYMNKF